MAKPPPGPPSLKAFRMLTGSDRGQLPAFLTAVARRYGAVSSWKMGPRVRFWLVDDARLIETVLLANGYELARGRGLQRIRRLLGLGLLTSDEPLHLRQRRLVQPAFHRERIAHYAETMVACGVAAAAGLHDGATVEVDELMNRLALRIAAATLFSADVDDDADVIGTALSEQMALFNTTLSPLAELYDRLSWHPATRRFHAAKAKLDGVVYKIIDERRASGEDRGDVLSILLSIRDEDGEPMPIERVRDEVLTLLLAGHETTANAMTWTFDALARTPEAEARLHAELDAVLGDRDPTPADLPNLRFTRDVVSEAMRLRPPAWILGRKAVVPFSLGDHVVEPGSTILVSQIVTHRNPAYWKEPEAFRPERWSNGETEGMPRFAYFPFGGGQRLCIGEGFAWTEATLLLATFARRLRFRLVDPTPIPLDPLVTLRPGRPVTMRIEARTGRQAAALSG